MERNDKKSLLMLLSSMLIYGSIGIFRRYIPLPSAVLACYRGAAGALFLCLWCRVKRHSLHQRIGGKALCLLILSGAVMGFNWILLFEAYNYTSVATATLCYYMQPTITMLLSPLVFRERLTLKKEICAALSVVGMALVSGVAEGGLPAPGEAKGILLGLGAAALYTTVIILNKKTPGIDAYQKSIIQLLSAAAALLPYLLLTRPALALPLSPLASLMLVIVGLVHTGLAYALYFGSMDGLQAQTVALFSYLDPITALLLSALALGERMSGLALLGAALMIGAAIVSELSPRRDRRRASH